MKASISNVLVSIYQLKYRDYDTVHRSFLSALAKRTPTEPPELLLDFFGTQKLEAFREYRDVQ